MPGWLHQGVWLICSASLLPVSAKMRAATTSLMAETPGSQARLQQLGRENSELEQLQQADILLTSLSTSHDHGPATAFEKFSVCL